MDRPTFKTLFLSLTVFVGVVLFSAACSVPTGSFFYGSLGLGDTRIVVANTQAGVFTVTLYNDEGQLVDVVADYTAVGQSPRGLAPFDAFSFLVALEGTDQIGKISFTDEGTEDWLISASLTGNIFQMAKDTLRDRYYVIETNTIEAFDANKVRIGNPYINTPIGSCTLNIARGMAMLPSGYLAVVGTGNDDLNLYDVSTSTPTCVTANLTFGNTDPVAVLGHSNGTIYVATQGDDRVYQFPGNGVGAATTIFNNIAIINNPAALAEMPDGTILVASEGTDSIERIQPDGTRVGAVPFIRDTFTYNVSEILVLRGQ